MLRLRIAQHFAAFRTINDTGEDDSRSDIIKIPRSCSVSADETSQFIIW